LSAVERISSGPSGWPCCVADVRRYEVRREVASMKSRSRRISGDCGAADRLDDQRARQRTNAPVVGQLHVAGVQVARLGVLEELA